jgi:hypothetical protein
MQSMKKTKLVIVLILLVSTAGFIFRLFFSHVNTVDYQLFRVYATGYHVHKLLGILPSEFQQRFEKKTIERYDNTEIIFVVDKVKSTHPYFVVEKKDSVVEFIKAHPYMLDTPGVVNGDSDDIANCISIQAFNRYLKHRKFDREEVFQKFCLFLSRQESTESFQILQDTADISTLISTRENMFSYLEKFPDRYKIISQEDIDFRNSNDNVVYCWFVNKGIIRFTFEFAKEFDELKSVDSELIGFLGIEVPM